MLSRPWNTRRSHYDFVIVGSGYGGAIAAARLVTANLSPRPAICVLERGRKWPVGSDQARLPGGTPGRIRQPLDAGLPVDARALQHGPDILVRVVDIDVDGSTSPHARACSDR
jgi:choline dehydrogenase-like flavoprotein